MTEQERINLYNRIYSASFTNLINESDKDGIVIPNFQGTLTDKYFIEVAKNVHVFYPDRKVYLESKFFQFWKFKLSNRKLMKGVHRYRESLNLKKLPLSTLKTFMAQEFETNLLIYQRIYKEFYLEAYGK